MLFILTNDSPSNTLVVKTEFVGESKIKEIISEYYSEHDSNIEKRNKELNLYYEKAPFPKMDFKALIGLNDEEYMKQYDISHRNWSEKCVVWHKEKDKYLEALNLEDNGNLEDYLKSFGFEIIKDWKEIKI